MVLPFCLVCLDFRQIHSTFSFGVTEIRTSPVFSSYCLDLTVVMFKNKLVNFTLQDWCWTDPSRCPNMRRLHVFRSHCRSHSSQLFHYRVHFQKNLFLAHANLVSSLSHMGCFLTIVHRNIRKFNLLHNCVLKYTTLA